MDAPRRFSMKHNRNGLGFYDGVEEDADGYLMTVAEHDRLMAERDARVAELEAEAERRDEQIQGMIEASGQTCACGYDRASDVCLGHYPHFKKSMAEARNKALEDAAQVADDWYYRIGKGTPSDEIRALEEKSE